MPSYLLLAALLPAIYLLVRVYRLDRVEKEPGGLILLLVGGGVLAAIPAAILESVLGTVLANRLGESTLLFLIIENFFVVAWSEEITKRLPVRLFAWRNPAFNYRFDAVVYCAASALGFAAFENVLYVAEYGFATAVYRALLSVPGHFFFAIYMGVYLGQAKVAELRGNMEMKRRFLRLSLIVPILLHGFWDFCLSFQSPVMTVVFYAFVVFFFINANKTLSSASNADAPL